MEYIPWSELSYVLTMMLMAFIAYKAYQHGNVNGFKKGYDTGYEDGWIDAESIE